MALSSHAIQTNYILYSHLFLLFIKKLILFEQNGKKTKIIIKQLFFFIIIQTSVYFKWEKNPSKTCQESILSENTDILNLKQVA